MSKRGYLLPEIIDPPTRRCVTFRVPDSQLWWAAFWGQMSDLLNAWLWEGTPEQKEEVTQAWLTVYKEARESWDEGECGVACEDCLGNIRLRVNNTTGEIEMSLDGGDTYITTGQTTNVYQTLELDTSRPEEESRCAMAANLFIWLMDSYGDMIDLLETYGDMASALDGVIALLPPLYITVDQISDAMNEILEAGVAVARAGDTIALRDAARCWLYCNSSEWGEMTSTQWGQFIEWVDTDAPFPDIPSRPIMVAFLNSFEPKAVAAQVRRWQQSEGACGDCGCDYDWTYISDFKEEQSFLGWEALSPYLTPAIVTDGLDSVFYYDEGSGVARRRIHIKKYLSYADGTTRVAKMTAHYWNADPAESNVIDPQILSPRIREVETANIDSGGNPTFNPGDGYVSGEFAGDVTILPEYYIGAYMQFAQTNGYIGTVGGGGQLGRLTIQGFGKNPFVP